MRTVNFPVDPEPLLIESLDQEARGVTHRDGKVVFVRDALAGERVMIRTVRRKPKFEVAELAEVLSPSAAREAPLCPNFGNCGGCSMQHLAARSQVAVKQRTLEDSLWHLGRVRPERILRPISGPQWGYRFRARLSVRYVARKGGVLVGFHERGSSFVADMTECRVLPERMSALLPLLRELVSSLDIRDRLPQIELAIGADLEDQQSGADDAVIALVMRVLEPPSEQDQARLRAFAIDHGLEVWLQPKGPDTITLFASGLPAGGLPASERPASNDPRQHSRLSYRLPEFGVVMPYRPTDFTQVNHRINQVLVAKALQLLDPQPTDRVLDLFCGLGNFTLPLATRSASVVGIEGSASLVARAAENARLNGLDARVQFAAENLFDWSVERWTALNGEKPFDRLLIDPPREGALAVAHILAQPLGIQPTRIVYVSCNPATLARDCAILVQSGRWQLSEAGVVNMFPQTSHVESIAVLDAVNPTAASS
jgi:23S rRNA (uracil1939-C5)-methyltransferase